MCKCMYSLCVFARHHYYNNMLDSRVYNTDIIVYYHIVLNDVSLEAKKNAYSLINV